MFFLIALTLIGIIVCNNFVNSEKIERKIVIIYSVIVCILLGISTLNPLKLFNVSNYTYVLWLLSLICLTFTLIICGRIFEKKIPEKDDAFNFDKITNSKFVILLEIIEMILLFYYFIKYNKIIQTIPSDQIRIARFTLLFSNAFETLFYNYIISGALDISIIIFSILLVNKKFKNLTFIIISINVILYTLIGLGRMTIFEIMIYIFIAFIYTKNLKISLNIKSIFRILTIMLIIFIVFTFMLCIRTKDISISIIDNIKLGISNQTSQTIEYFLGGLRMLDYYIVNGFNEFDGMTYGRATFAGIEEIILYPLKGIGFDVNSFNNMAANIMERPLIIGEGNHYFNAFYTQIMNFYLDFGMWGVIIYSILHALFIVLTVQLYRKNKDVTSFMLLLFATNNLIFTVIKWPYQSGTKVFELIILVLITFICNYRRKEVGKQSESTLDS